MTATRPEAALSPGEILAEADAEIAEAEARAAAIAQAVKAGDPSVTFEQFEAAQKQSAWAKLRRGAAERRAEARRLEIWKAPYEELVKRWMPKVFTDPTPEIEALLEQAKPFIQEALELAHQRNVALIKITEHAINPKTYKGTDENGYDELSGYMQEPSSEMRNTWPTSEITYRGRTAKFTPATKALRRMLKSMKSDLLVLSAGIDRSWIDPL